MKEKLQAFRDFPKTLPRLIHARYANNYMQASPSKISGTEIYRGHRAPKKHRPHQVHTQHRHSIVAVLELLIQRLDIRTMECKFINPRYGIDRALYVAEIAQKTGLAERTVQRCIGSLVRSGYIIRMANLRRIFFTLTFVQDIKVNLAYGRLKSQLMGLDKKATLIPSKQSKDSRKNFGHRNNLSNETGFHPSHSKYQHEPHQGTQDREAAASHLKMMRSLIGRRQKPPPE